MATNNGKCEFGCCGKLSTNLDSTHWVHTCNTLDYRIVYLRFLNLEFTIVNYAISQAQNKTRIHLSGSIDRNEREISMIMQCKASISYTARMLGLWNVYKCKW